MSRNLDALESWPNNILDDNSNATKTFALADDSTSVPLRLPFTTTAVEAQTIPKEAKIILRLFLRDKSTTSKGSGVSKSRPETNCHS